MGIDFFFFSTVCGSCLIAEKLYWKKSNHSTTDAQTRKKIIFSFPKCNISINPIPIIKSESKRRKKTQNERLKFEYFKRSFRFFLKHTHRTLCMCIFLGSNILAVDWFRFFSLFFYLFSNVYTP